MRKYVIEEDTLECVEHQEVNHPEGVFDTEEVIEVRVPFTGYYTLNVKCKEHQSAMLEVLRANHTIGLSSLTGVETVIDVLDIDETYCFVDKKEGK